MVESDTWWEHKAKGRPNNIGIWIAAGGALRGISGALRNGRLISGYGTTSSTAPI